ncbi:hypothetical protein BUALT_Bualt17G0045300 [Buddleja alternifolia]|uniref:Ubiquitin-like protease family profile domain-containing protein n=1 Tax=Buddleja alternifolia TaxID=168488 RepID=A0AAV6WGU7_9LAMI|nr:hypothetical protein BUALT_Bualt17G0045300 [Buddleja alternifolia]
MEGGGERKRKAPLELDWDKLLPAGQNDDEPPPVVVIEAAAAEKSKPQEEAMLVDGEEDSPKDEFLTNLSEKDLIDKIARLKRSSPLVTSKLPDGGVKLRASLKRHEAELERRKLLKGDDKGKKDTPLTDESTCNGKVIMALDLSEKFMYFVGASDDPLPVGAPISVPASQSTFAFHFCSKMDDKRANTSFREELSTLNRCDHKNTRESRQFPNQRTQQMCLSSREAPFRSPSLLSVKTDNPPQSNGEQSGSHSSTPSPHLSDRDAIRSLAKKESSPRFQPTRNSRRDKRTVVLVDEEELEVDEPDQADKVDQSMKEFRISYPSRDDPRAVDIWYSDMECLAPQYLQKPKSPTPRKSCNYHFFNTYFYVRLKRDVLKKGVSFRLYDFMMQIDKEASFVNFRRWWKGVNLFEKAYIFLPIHENFLIEEWKFLRQEDVLPELPIADNIWERLSRRIDEKVIEVPQQRNEYDCGLFVLYFIERFIEEAPERLKKKDLEMWFKPEEASEKETVCDGNHCVSVFRLHLHVSVYECTQCASDEVWNENRVFGLFFVASQEGVEDVALLFLDATTVV